MRPRFSIVIPISESAGTISRTLAGVLSQTFAGLEVVAVDAGAKSETLEAVRLFGDSRVRVLTPSADTERDALETQPWTVPEARAVGFEHSRGKWATTLDASDEVEPNWLARLGLIADSSEATFISCGGSQRFSDLSETHMSPTDVPNSDGLVACLRSGAFVAPTRYFQDLEISDLDNLVSVGLEVLNRVIAEGRRCISTPESLLRWNEVSDDLDDESHEEQQLRWALQALDAISRAPIPESELLARYAALGADAAARLGNRDQARRLYAIARDTLPKVPRYWFGWLGTLVPFAPTIGAE